MQTATYKIDGDLEPAQMEARQREIAGRVAHQRAKDAANHGPYQTPRTAYEWWAVALEWWPEISGIVQQFAQPDVLNSVAATGVVTTSQDVASAAVLRMKQCRDVTLARVLEAAWTAAPDRGEIHESPGWPVFCDLYERSWLLDENYNTMLCPVEALKLHSGAGHLSAVRQNV